MSANRQLLVTNNYMDVLKHKDRVMYHIGMLRDDCDFMMVRNNAVFSNIDYIPAERSERLICIKNNESNRIIKSYLYWCDELIGDDRILLSDDRLTYEFLADAEV